MVKVISFSLWGNDPKYTQGAIKNARLAAELFPDWVCRFYFGQSVDRHKRFEILEAANNPQSIIMPESGDWRGMFWRFDAINDPSVDVMISRDCDSRLSPREKAAVDEWLASDKGFHIMRDHPWHTSPIMGGMFGMKKDAVPAFPVLLKNWKQEDRWQTDQEFLAQDIWPRIQNDVMIHDSFYKDKFQLGLGVAQDFSTARESGKFVGQAVEADGSVNQEHVNMLDEGPLI